MRERVRVCRLILVVAARVDLDLRQLVDRHRRVGRVGRSRRGGSPGVLSEELTLLLAEFTLGDHVILHPLLLQETVY